MLADVTASSLARFSCLDRQPGSFTAERILCLAGLRLKKTQNQNNRNQLLQLFWVLKAAKKPLYYALLQTLSEHMQSGPGRSCRSFLNRTCSSVSYELRLFSVLSRNAS